MRNFGTKMLTVSAASLVIGSAVFVGASKADAAENTTKGNLSIGDHVWWDANRNNLYDAGENPVAGLQVTLRDYAGNPVAETTTDANGNYAFHGLANGTYTLNFNNPLDWSPVIANIGYGANDDTNSDGPIDVRVVLDGADNYNIDQGYYGVGTPAAGGGTATTEQPTSEQGGGGVVTTEQPTSEQGGGVVTTEQPTSEQGGGVVTTEQPTSEQGGGVVTTEQPTSEAATSEQGGGNVTTEQPTSEAATSEATTSEAAKESKTTEAPKAGETKVTELPDTGETPVKAGLLATLVAFLGGTALVGARRK